MKILHIHTTMRTGGVEAMINALSNEMIKEHDVYVCSIFQPHESWQFWNSLNTKINKLTLNKNRPGFSIKQIFQIFTLIRKGEFDVVNLHGFMIYYIPSILFLRKRTKFFYTVHSDARKENTRWDKRVFFLKKFLFKKEYVHPITISEESQNSFLEYYRCNSSLIRNGITIQNKQTIFKGLQPIIKPHNTTQVFINVGRIDIPKNQVALCSIFNELIKEGYDIMLIIAGPIIKINIFEEIQMVLSPRIQYIGEVSNPLEYFVMADALVMPSIWEGLPVTLLEAMSVGCIPICTPVGGMKEVICNGVNGFLSSNNTNTEFKQKIIEYLSLSPEQKKIIQKNAEETIKSKYSISITSKQYIRLYSGLDE